MNLISIGYFIIPIFLLIIAVFAFVNAIECFNNARDLKTMNKQVKFNKLPESIVIKGTEYFLERYEPDTAIEGFIFTYIYKDSKYSLTPNVFVKYPYGVFREFLCSFDKTEQKAYDDLLYRINNIVE